MNRCRQYAVNGAGSAGEKEVVKPIEKYVENRDPRDRFGGEGVLDSPDVQDEFNAQRDADHDNRNHIQLARRRNSKEPRSEHQEQGNFKVTLHADVRMPLPFVCGEDLWFAAHK